MIDALVHLLTALRRAQVDVTAEDVADAIWLALRPGTVPEGRPAPPPEAVAPRQAAAPPPPAEPSRPVSAQPSPPTPKAPLPEPGRAGYGELHLPQALPGGTGAGGRAFRSPTGAALPGALALARALRPLRQRVASRTRLVFDAPETVRRVAEEGIWLPALRPARDRWLDVSLVVDAGASMGVWRAAAAELRKLLEWMGAFRSLRVWRLETDVSPPLLQPGLRRRPGVSGRSPLELVDPNGRSLVLLLTDCVSNAWHDGSAARLLDTWARRGPLALLQVLPEHLWPRTALGAASPVRFTAPGAASPNARLRAEAMYDWPDVASVAGTPVLVSSLEPNGLAALARLVAGLGGGTAAGFVLATGMPASPTPEAGAAPSANTRVTRFWQVASPVARRLAGLLAAAPVLSLPVVRLVRQALLPGAWQVHEAEVLLGGLLRAVPGQDEETLDPDEILYDFHDGVRAKLLDAVPTADTLQVLEKVSGYVEEHLAQSTDFRALLADPGAHQGAFLPDNSPFAHIAAEVLGRLGGEYARLVQSLAQVPGPVPGPGEEPAAAPQPRPDVLRGHTRGVRAVAFSPDGSTLASGSVDETAKLWDWTTGEVRATLRGHKRGAKPSRDHPPGVSAVAFAPDGKSLASGGLDGTIRLWSVADGKELTPLRGHAGRVRGLAFAPDGQTLASASDDQNAELWEVASRSKRFSLRGHAETVECVAFAPEGLVIATGSRDGTARLWEAATGKALATLRGHKSEVLAVAFSPDGKTLATASAAGTVRLWDVAARQEQVTLGAHQSSCRAVVFSPDGRTLASAGRVVRLWNVATGQERACLREHAGKVFGLAFAPDGKTLASAGEDQTVRLGDVPPFIRGSAETGGQQEPALPQTVPRHWVLVIGTSYDAAWLDKVVEASRLVGATLAREGYGLLTGAWPGVDSFVADSFAQELALCRRGPLASWFKQIVRQGTPHSAPGGGLYRNPEGEVLEVESTKPVSETGIRLADAVILIGGEGDSLEIARRAREEGKPVFPLAFTGGNAQRVHSLVLRDWPEHTLGAISREDFQALEQPLDAEGQPLKRLLGAVLKPEKASGDRPPRVQITYDLEAAGGAGEKVELPFVIGVLADLVGEHQEAPGSLKDRSFVSIDRHTFAEVLQKAAPRLALKVKDRLTDADTELAVELTFRHLSDFEPAGLIEQLAPLKTCLERLRQLLTDQAGLSALPMRPSELLERTYRDEIARLSSKLSAQLNEILHHPAFQRLEATWRGLHYLVEHTATGANLKIRVLNVRKHELLEDLKEVGKPERSALFQKIYAEPFGQPRGEPFGLLVGDYEFSHTPEDIDLLRLLSRVAATAHAPLVAAASPPLFRLGRFTELETPKGLETMFGTAEYAAWNSFRELDDARFVALTLPHVLGRLPYGKDYQRLVDFEFDEFSDGQQHDRCLWTSAAWAYAVRVGEAFARWGWLARTVGPDGGRVEGLPFLATPMEGGAGVLNCPAEIALRQRREFDLSGLGFLPLIFGKGRLSAEFVGGYSCHRPRPSSEPAAPQGADPTTQMPATFLLTRVANSLAAQIPATLCLGRFAHCLAFLARDALAAGLSPADCERRLESWLQSYVLPEATGRGEEASARQPLAEARLELCEVHEQRGTYKVMAWLRPRYQFEEVTGPVRLVIPVPRKQEPAGPLPFPTKSTRRGMI